MSSGPELERFLTELEERRVKVLRLAEPSGPLLADLIAELNELSQQLIVADEELRVQQEELERARHSLIIGDLWQELLGDPDQVGVLTDRFGVVVHSTPAAQRLTRQPRVRISPRPIATWFDVPDRRTVRRMIGQVSAVGERGDADLLHLTTSQGDQTTLRANVQGVADPVDGRLMLRWELVPAGERRLRAVPDAAVDDSDPGPGSPVAAALVTRQLLEQAVGALVERHGFSARAAFDRLVHYGEEAGVELNEVARAVVETGLDPSEDPGL